jgi:hypothetical protein
MKIKNSRFPAIMKGFQESYIEQLGEEIAKENN